MGITQGYAANLLTRGSHQQAIFSFSFWHLEVWMGKMCYKYMDVCVSIFLYWCITCKSDIFCADNKGLG
jgi:hypothetical protein